MRRVISKIDEISVRPKAKHIIYIPSLLFFVALIFLPPIAGILQKISLIVGVYDTPVLFARANLAVVWSFVTAFTVAILDLNAALPLAWFIVRSKLRLINVIDTLADIPFLIPTAALGYSAVLFWNDLGGLSYLFGVPSFISPGFFLVLLLHFAFSYPVIVRVMVGELLSYKEVYEVAAKTLGAQPFTAVRTVTLPLLKPALIASFLLAFARSLSETGATVIAAGTFENGSVFIFNNINTESVLVYVSFVLIVTSVMIFFLVRLLAPKLKFPIKRAFPLFERILSCQMTVNFRNIATFIVFLFFVIAPSLFIGLPMINALTDGTLSRALGGGSPWDAFWRSMLISYSIGLISTLINVALGLPMAILIARRKLGKITPLLDALVDVPIIIPSIAFGVSLRFFWEGLGLLPEFWLLIFSHAAITYTYFVKSMSASLQSVSLEMEEVASTLGANPFTIFRRLTLPLTRYSVFSGAVLVFTRALGETGAAKAVVRSSEWYTAPVLLVDWIANQKATVSQSALGIGFIIITSFAVLLALRLIIRRKR